MAYHLPENFDIEVYRTKLNNLDADYEVLQQCKLKLAESSVFLNDLLTQCDDIKKVFDRATIEGRYDSYQITFKNKNLVFDYLDNIVSSTNKFRETCENVKSKIDSYGVNLDDECKNIAKEADKISFTISTYDREPPRV